MVDTPTVSVLVMFIVAVSGLALGYILECLFKLWRKK